MVFKFPILPVQITEFEKISSTAKSFAFHKTQLKFHTIMYQYITGKWVIENFNTRFWEKNFSLKAQQMAKSPTTTVVGLKTLQMFFFPFHNYNDILLLWIILRILKDGLAQGATSYFCIHVKWIAPKNIHNSLLTNSALESQLPSVACHEMQTKNLNFLLRLQQV